MSGFLLDTNVVSELTKHRPDPRVVAFLSSQDGLWLSALVVHELEFGLRLLPPGDRRDGLRQVLAGIITRYEDRVLPVEAAAARWAARFRAREIDSPVRAGVPDPGALGHRAAMVPSLIRTAYHRL